jgi:Fe-S cluster assembly protein SufD
MATQPTGMEMAKDHYLSAFRQLALDDGRQGSEWVNKVRADAIKQFGDAGFPSGRDERWRFTNFAGLVEKNYTVGNGQTMAVPELPDGFGSWGASRIVFVNGIFSPELSSVQRLPDGVFAGRLSGAISEGIEPVSQNLARIERPSENPFAALNTAFLTDGTVLCVPDRVVVDEPIQFLYLTSDENAAAVTQPRNLVILGESAEATVVEGYFGFGNADHWTNVVTESVVGDGAQLHAYRIQLEGSNTYHTAATRSRQGRDSRYAFTTIEFGGLLSRHDIRAILDGTGAECLLNGLLQVSDKQHVDQHTTIEHAQPHGSSRESFNGIFDGRSHGVFTGRILVQHGAQQTDARQSSRNLLLSDTARVDTQPQLEIFANDVKCTHGATVGPIDDEAMFYLQSKGLTSDAARAMLTYGFGSEISSSILMDDLRGWVDAKLQSRLNDANRERKVIK